MSTRPVDSWRRPERPVLEEEVFPWGIPDFDPFPSVTEVCNAYHCPLAAYHDFWFNVDNPFRPKLPRGVPVKAGDRFNNFIAHLKTRLVRGEIPPGGVRLSWIRSEFEDFEWEMDDPHRLWDLYLEPWATRKLNELRQIGTGRRIYFEVWAASAYVPFAVESGGFRTYPLFGWIDEVDLESQRLIERTIKGGRGDDPPYLKDYQLWLYWKLLCAIRRSDYPPQWADVNFKDFELIVETPSRDYPVQKNNPEFETKTHEAYKWIRWLASESRVVRDVYDERRCTPDRPSPECQAPCWRKRPDYPTPRYEMRKEFKRWCRAILHELMWERDLRLYQFTMLNENQLEQLEHVMKCRVIERFSDNKIEVEVPPRQASFLSAASGDKLKTLAVIPFGSFSVGLRYRAHAEPGSEPNQVLLELETKSATLCDHAFILTEGVFVFEEQPIFLDRQLQGDLCWLEKRGRDSPAEASKYSWIQLLEAVFGRKNLSRG